MHQIQFRLGPRHRARRWSLQRSPRPSSCMDLKGIRLRGRVGKGRVRRERGDEGMRVDGRVGDPKGWFTPHVRNHEKYPDCRTDLIGGAATQTFAPGGKQPRAATA